MSDEHAVDPTPRMDEPVAAAVAARVFGYEFQASGREPASPTNGLHEARFCPELAMSQSSVVGLPQVLMALGRPRLEARV